ncbi:MAG: GNAT family N-acetyltransferase, partial [Planctomycetota bacterium]
MSNTFEVRQVTPDELPTATAVANRAFGFGQEGGFEFKRNIPYVWNADRADNTWAAFDGDEMIGMIGAYPFDVRMAGVDFRATCVGQVGTPAEHRGRGVMSALLTAATAKMDAEVDFAWLGGDRLRYGRFGWAFGGERYSYTTNTRYLPDPPDASAVRAMDPAVDGD